MQNARFLKQLVVSIIIALPLVYLLLSWNVLPERMPLHYNAKGEIDSMGNKMDFLGAIFILSIVNLATFLIISNIHKIDPKRSKAELSPTFDKLAMGTSLFLTGLTIVIIIDGMNQGKSIATKVLLPMVGLLVAFIGNYMNNIKPNYFAGIRIPWTLHDEDNWKQTHRVASHVWVAGGLTITIASLIAKPEIMEMLMLVLIAIMVVIPVGYSYLLFRKTKSQKQ